MYRTPLIVSPARADLPPLPFASFETRRDLASITDVATHALVPVGDRLQIAVVDIDGYDVLMDRCGPATVDRVLRAVAGVLNESIGSNGFVLLHGDHTFVMLLPGRRLPEAEDICRRMRAGFGTIQPTPGQSVTASVGLAECSPGDADVMAAVARAESVLRLARQHGPDCIGIDDLVFA